MTWISPEREQPNEVSMDGDAPIVYRSLHPSHLKQVHDLLGRVFWDGIDGTYLISGFWSIQNLLLTIEPVSDAFQYSPERCTIVATYKQLVVGAAFLSSPLEAYITYLVVREGWNGSRIAT